MTLETFLFDSLLETECKIGYTETVIRFRFPVRMLAGILGNREMPAAAVMAAANARFAGCEALRGSEITEIGGLLHLALSPSAAKYVHTTYRAENPGKAAFFDALAGVTATPFATKEDVHRVFLAGGGRVTFTPSDSGEFDEIIAFEDQPEEPFYCFEYGEERVEYHRLLPEDYRELFV